MAGATPTRLGRYQILDQIGKGAMGVVYLAKDPVIGRLVALKTFRMAADLGDEDLARSHQRFMREAQSAGILSHPNIVTVHDVVEEHGTSFIAMEFVRGTDLKQLLRRGERFDLPAVSDIVWQVAEALEYAHSKGVVHRDIKPANILITGDGRVKLTDFGIARLNTSNLTHDGQLLGTPNYMSPEQVQGREVDQRTDIFSLGVVFYEMLTHHKPFPGENLTVVAHRIVNGAFTPPEEHTGPMPQPLLAILERALAKQPDQRYQRAGELARDLKLVADEASAMASLTETQEIDPVVAPAAGPSRAPVMQPLGEGWARTRVALVARRLQALRGRLRREEGGPVAGSWRRPALVAGVTAVASLLAGWLMLTLLTPPEASVAEAALDAEIHHRFSYLPSFFDGRRLLAESDAAAAAAAFAEAERLAPDEPRIRELRRQADRQAAESTALALRQDAAAAALAEGERALARGQPTRALAGAERALALVPEHPEAQALLARVEAALRRQQAAAAEPELPPAVVAVPSPSAPPAVAAPEPAPGPVPGGTARLSIAFHSERSQGVLMVYADDEQMLREPFKFVEKTGLFRSREVAGDLARSVTLPSGPVALRVYVSLDREDRTRVASLEGNFPPGSARTLEIRVSTAGELSARLR